MTNLWHKGATPLCVSLHITVARCTKAGPWAAHRDAAWSAPSPLALCPRQPFLGQGSKLGRNGETRRPAGAETGKRGGQPGPKRGNGGHKHWDDCARPRNIDYATTDGLGTTDAARFGSYLRSICLSEAEAWTCKSSGCPQHPHGTIGTPT